MRYLAQQTREVIIEAPSAAVARTVAMAAFGNKLSPTQLAPGMSCSNIQTVDLKVEKVK